MCFSGGCYGLYILNCHCILMLSNCQLEEQPVTANEYPRLCGGTFFTLVLQALQQRMNARNITRATVTAYQIRRCWLDLSKWSIQPISIPVKKKLKTIVNNYKQGRNSNSTYFPFHDNQVLSAFDFTVTTNHQTALNRMIRFVNDFLDLSQTVHKDVNLVRALVDLIQKDESIKDGDEFYIGLNGEKEKAALCDLKEICLPAFLLGVWHYVVINRKDNSVGKRPMMSGVRQLVAGRENILPTWWWYPW